MCGHSTQHIRYANPITTRYLRCVLVPILPSWWQLVTTRLSGDGTKKYELVRPGRPTGPTRPDRPRDELRSSDLCSRAIRDTDLLESYHAPHFILFIALYLLTIVGHVAVHYICEP